jgi:UPF0755 protein
MRSVSRSSRRARATRAILGLLATGALFACGGSGGPPVRVVVPSGASFTEATDSLARAGVVAHPGLFRAYAKARRADRTVKAGTYRLPRDAKWAEVLDALTNGRTAVGTVTIPEGFALAQIVPLLARTLAVPEDSVAAAMRDTALRRNLDVPTPTLEGYLFPSTYTFADGTTPIEAVRQMVAELERRWRPEWNAQLDTLSMSRHDVLTLAAIVEKEARLPEERAVISAVYHNRLKRRMPLQADPTVQYARGQHTSRVLYRDLDVDSPYNTYRHAGLPPGPIASPGLPSIEAALFPAKVPYLFFVAHPDGHHEFRTTFEEHTKARLAIRRAQEAAGSRPPRATPRRPDRGAPGGRR